MVTYANREAAEYKIIRNDGALIASVANGEIAASLVEWLNKTARDGATFTAVRKGERGVA